MYAGGIPELKQGKADEVFGTYRPMISGSEFLEKYPKFLESNVGAHPNRLKTRFDMLIARQESLLLGARVLDLGSHDGRWALAVLEAGASHVTGLEGRPEQVERAQRLFRHYNVESDRFDFRQGDFHTLLPKIEQGSVDVVLCLGVLYHTPHNVLLLQQLRRLQPKHIILDTRVLVADRTVFALEEETWQHAGHGIREQAGNETAVLYCVPSHNAVHLMCQNLGISLTGIDWHDGSISNWDGIPQYKAFKRRSYLLSLERSQGAVTGA